MDPFLPCSAVFLLLLAHHALAQPPDDGCNGILLTYTLQARDKIRPFVLAPDSQPYSFRANATVRNSGTRPLRSWALLLTFVHGEILVSVDGAVLTSGGDNLPYNTTAADAGNATSFTGYPQTDLLTPIATAGDITKIQATVNLVGTLFAGPDPFEPLPTTLSLDDPSYACPPATNVSRSLSTCCMLTPAAAAGNASATDPATTTFLPRRTGDLVITYDVLQSYDDTTYLALVTLDNGAPLGRLDGWQLSWAWERREFIKSMRGAYPKEVGAAACLYGAQGQYYKDLDFSKVLNCERTPVVVDLPPSRANDADIGRINHCCRNGTILPKSMDVAQSKSAFQMEVYKMPPDLNRTKLYPPASFQVHGASPLNPDYKCGQPIPVSPSEFPDPSGLASTTVAVATWQVVCNITTGTETARPSQAPSKLPSCCVSFSSFYNESVIPCRTCACGCPATQPAVSASCSTTAPSMLLPPYALLMPFDRRAKEALSWADQKHLSVPNPMPCGDSCGVSINWHVATDFTGGWSARLTLFNWGDMDMQEWFTAIVMDKAYDGFEQAYSFNATAVGNSTIFIKGREGFNFLLRETNMSGVDYPVPGKLQSVLSFTKKTTPGIDVVAGDGFPSKVFFNGDECAMPLRIPSQGANTGVILIPMLLCLVASTLLLLL
ncbi:COBRA-like protein 7 [Dichanthelium oligosanthes]|uniref:COBRA-like protein 7 n=1 Tax=Dichanthelium oligosanthes TaxID=888268 RepID=A0A1E5VSD4_9POAL|nr:COBRA-like protein 7 [Dichanthelium oligosanthes]